MYFPHILILRIIFITLLHNIMFFRYSDTYLDISNKNIKSLSEINFSLYPCLKVLDCSYNHLTDLEYCPQTVTRLICHGNRLNTLKHCPDSVKYLYCSNNRLTDLKYCPESVKILDCRWNKILKILFIIHRFL